jgi:hypothetical protein
MEIYTWEEAFTLKKFNQKKKSAIRIWNVMVVHPPHKQTYVISTYNTCITVWSALFPLQSLL